ncbi:MAG: PAC2 family protein [Candidatus Altiarchaeota archaeon]
MTTKIVTHGKIPENPRVIEAFPSNGFVSTIAAQRIIEQLSMEIVGYIDSDKTQGICVIHNSKPLKPARIYAKDDLVIVYSEVIIPLEYVGEFSKALCEWFDKIKPAEVILLAGISGIEAVEEHEILAIATTQELSGKLSDSKAKIITDGMITGISADILMDCIQKKIPCVSLVTETHFVPDPMASASMLGILNKLLDLSVETEELMKVGERIEDHVKNITEHLKRGKEKYRRMEGFSPMYG